jgi:hypothetical protein
MADMSDVAEFNMEVVTTLVDSLVDSVVDSLVTSDVKLEIDCFPDVADVQGSAVEQPCSKGTLALKTVIAAAGGYIDSSSDESSNTSDTLNFLQEAVLELD